MRAARFMCNEFVLLASEQSINVELPRERARSLALAVGVAYRRR